VDGTSTEQFGGPAFRIIYLSIRSNEDRVYYVFVDFGDGIRGAEYWPNTPGKTLVASSKEPVKLKGAK
jgi:hypothetical protein